MTASMIDVIVNGSVTLMLVIVMSYAMSSAASRMSTSWSVLSTTSCGGSADDVAVGVVEAMVGRPVVVDDVDVDAVREHVALGDDTGAEQSWCRS